VKIELATAQYTGSKYDFPGFGFQSLDCPTAKRRDRLNPGKMLWRKTRVVSFSSNIEQMDALPRDRRKCDRCTHQLSTTFPIGTIDFVHVCLLYGLIFDIELGL
jgi:hypothetical protein